MNIKRIIREELDSGLQWIKDVKSNKDIAEELFSQTVITKDKGIVKLPFSWSRHQPKKPYFDLSIRKKYGEDKDSDDIWERYKVLVNNRLKEITGKGIKESNDLQWIKDVKPTLNDAFEQGTLKKGDVLTLSGELADCDAITTKEVNDFKIKITKLKKKINNSYFIPLQKKYWEHLEYEGKGDTRFYGSDGKMTIEDHHNNLNESNDLQWIRDIKPIPNEILNIDKYPPGDYKIWLGDIPKDQQLMIIDYIIDVIESRDDLSTSSSLYSIRDIVRKDEAYFNSLYFDIYPPGNEPFIMNKSNPIVVAMMAWYPKEGLDKYHTLEYCRKYFDRHGDTELSTAKIEDHHNNLNESNDLQWIRDIKPIPELKVGTCFIDVMDSTQTEWIIIDFKMTPGGTPIVVIKNKKNNTDIRYKHEGYFEEDLLSHRYKPCSNKLMESKLFK